MILINCRSLSIYHLNTVINILINKIKTNPSLQNCQKGYASVNEKRMNMLIDFDGLTIIIGIVIYILICIFIHKKYKKRKYITYSVQLCFVILCVLLS